jgi:hypothetical protein
MALWSESQRRAAGLIEDELRRFADDVAGDGARLVIMYVPNPTQVGGSECSVGRLFDRLAAGTVLPEDSGVQAWLREVAARAGVPFLDPTRAMREFDSARPYADAEPLYLRADCHWSVRGHTFIANWLADWYAGASEGLR